MNWETIKYRLVYRNDETKVPFWIYLMLLYTFWNGLWFTFFFWTDPVQRTALYEITASAQAGPSIWGIACLLAVLLSLSNIVIRKKFLGKYGTYLGYGVWFYALTAYVGAELWFQSGFAVIQIIFWGWHHLRVTQYYRNLEKGIEPPRKYENEQVPE